MNKLYTLILFLLCQFSYSQACGEGKFIFEFHQKYSSVLNYEITSVEINDDKLISEDLYMGVYMDSIKLN